MARLENIRDNAHDAGWRVSLAGAVGAPVLARPLAMKRCITNLVENGVSYGSDLILHNRDGGGLCAELTLPR